MVRPDRRSVQRTALRPTDHRFVRELVHELQAELAGSGDDDGRSRDLGDPYHDPAVGSALPSRIRKALAALRSLRRRLVEDGRDLYKGSRTLGVPVPCRRQSGPDGGFFLSRNRDVNAAKSFLRSAMKNTRVPTRITLDAYAASHRAVREMKQTGELPRRVKVRSSQYLNNLVEQDHRRVKQRIRPMLGFKRFDNAVVTISGVELAEKIKKRTIQDRQVGRPKGDDVGVVERGTRCLSPSQVTQPGGTQPNPRWPEFAPEPYFHPSRSFGPHCCQRP